MSNETHTEAQQAAVEATLDTPQGEALLLHLKLLAAEGLPDELCIGPAPEVMPGVSVGGVVLEMGEHCSPELAAYVLRRVADHIEQDAAEAELLRTMRN